MAAISKFAVFGLFANVFVLASPGLLKDRGVCNHDNCLRAVIASNAKPYPSSASADCVSFLQETVTNAPATVTLTNTVTETADTPTATVRVSSTVTASTETDTLNVPFTTTDATQVLTTTVSTVDVQNTITNTITNVVSHTDTVTITLTSPTVASFVPRPTPNQARRNALEARVVTLTSPVVPTYASACSGTVRYSSACSCIGVAHQTITTTPPDYTTTIDQTVTITPDTVTITSTDYIYVTATTTVTSSQRVDATLTQYNSVTATTTLSPVTTSTTTVSTTTIVTTTTTTLPAPTQYCKMNLKASSSVASVNGRFVYMKDFGLVRGIITGMIAPSGSTLKTAFQLDVNSKLHPVEAPANGLTIFQSPAFFDIGIYAADDARIAALGYSSVHCTINSVTLELTCSSVKGNALHFFHGILSVNAGNFLNLATDAPANVPIQLFAVPVGCTS